MKPTLLIYAQEGAEPVKIRATPIWWRKRRARIERWDQATGRWVRIQQGESAPLIVMDDKGRVIHNGYPRRGRP